VPTPTPKPEPKRLVDVTKHAKGRARERLGVNPSTDWWQSIADGIVSGKFMRTMPPDIRGACPYRVPARSDDGEKVDLEVVACVEPERVSVISIWIAGERYTLH
jgi:hypothetical protein